jgi:uncharacterized protein YjbJ (UPF0337 family)
MNISIIYGKWNEQKGKFKQQLASWTDNYLLFEEGRNDERTGRLQLILAHAKVNLNISTKPC